MAAVLSSLRRNPSLVIGAVLVTLIVAMALLALVWTPYPPGKLAMMSKLQGPSAAHWFGTDQFGRDLFSQIMKGAGNALYVAALAVLIGAAIGTTLGLFAAALGGWVEEILMRLCDFAYAFPAVLLAIVIAALLGVGATTTILAIAIFTIPVFGRLARGAALEVMGRAFIMAARLNGRSLPFILIRHVLPNIAGLLIVQVSTQIALAIIVEAGLSYLGIGLQPPAISWGKMLADAQTHMSKVPTMAIFPGAMIAIAVLGFNLLGDGLRDLLDPRLRRAR